MATDNRVVRGHEQLSRRIATIRRNLGLPAMVDEIGKLLHRRHLERFDREVDPNYVPWVELSPATLAIKRRLGYGHKGKLQRTGALRSAIRIIRGGLGTVYTNTGAGLRIGVEDPRIAEYARDQNEGTSRIPARRFLGIGALDVKAVDSLMRRKAAALNKAMQ